jgi:hypothetical protein
MRNYLKEFEEIKRKENEDWEVNDYEEWNKKQDKIYNDIKENQIND